MSLIFEWDAAKDRANFLKHGVSFASAMSVFADPLARVMDDSLHSATERRYVILGRTRRGALLTVVFTERDGRIRIINARISTRTERTNYEKDSR